MVAKKQADEKRVAELTVGELRDLIESTVRDVLDQVLPDHIDIDEGLELRPEVQEELERYLNTPLEQQTFYDLDDVAKELGLDE